MPKKQPALECQRLVTSVAAKRIAKPSVRLARSIQEIGEYNAGFDKGSEGGGRTDRRVLRGNTDGRTRKRIRP